MKLRLSRLFIILVCFFSGIIGFVYPLFHHLNFLITYNYHSVFPLNKVYPSSTSIGGTLGNFRLCDLSLGSDHCWGWLCDLRNQEAESLIQVIPYPCIDAGILVVTKFLILIYLFHLLFSLHSIPTVWKTMIMKVTTIV